MPTIQTSECDPDTRGGGSLTLHTHTHTQVFVSLRAPNVYRQSEYIFDHNNTPTGRSGGGTAVLDDGDKHKRVIVVEVTVADRPSVQFEVVRRMDGRTK